MPALPSGKPCDAFLMLLCIALPAIGHAASVAPALMSTKL